ncbi:fluoride efflux transporter CrcB [Bacillus rubiinfantis]|uniref:fluoride efflux transporter CrcB n=1 Tax=Bacillus rubiinfantis TaxID=1499680 RepID=UPI0005A6A222|nr:fluoride efflux transporter CrcB [Bacillus rubiinfantis]
MVYLWVGLGGMLGSIIRYILSQVTAHFWYDNFPLGTLIVNLTGCFLLGWITTRMVSMKRLHPKLLTAVTTGVIGSYTTFSTFCLETVQLLQSGNIFLACMYIFLSLAGGLLLVNLGLETGKSRLKAGEVK